MISEEREALEQRQIILMRRYRQYEAMQTDFSHDPDFYRYAEGQMQKLDDEADLIRCFLESSDNYDL